MKLAQESRERHQIVENFLLAIGVSRRLPDALGRDGASRERRDAGDVPEIYPNTGSPGRHDSSFVQSLLRDRFSICCDYRLRAQRHRTFVPASWPAAIDWHTIVTLSGLMLLTKGIELSGYFDVLGRKMARRFVTERQLAIFMVLAAALLSTFLTNDVALFIVVPLTLTLKKWCAIPVNRLIIFEALAVNAGSLLTPIGNPQNILLWGRSGLSFFGFIGQMLPLAAAERR